MEEGAYLEANCQTTETAPPKPVVRQGGGLKVEMAAGIIPARYGIDPVPGEAAGHYPRKTNDINGFTREPGGPGCLSEVIVATDDERILKACADLGIPARMTSAAHGSGTDRVAEVARELDAGLIVNIQGDEPVLDPGAIDALVEALQDPSVVMASLMTRVKDAAAFEDLNRVKVVVDKDRNALYFSRTPIPCRAPDGFLPAYRHLRLQEGIPFPLLRPPSFASSRKPRGWSSSGPWRTGTGSGWSKPRIRP